MKKLMGTAVTVAIGLSALLSSSGAEDLRCMELSGNYRGAEAVLLTQVRKLGSVCTPQARLQLVKLLDQLVELEIVLNDLPRAALYEHKVISLLRTTPHVVSMDIVGAVHRLAQINDAMNSLHEAQSEYLYELSADQAFLGDQSVVSLTPLYDVAASFEAGGQLDEAEAAYQKAFQIMEKTVGANNMVLSSDWIFLGRVAYEKGEYSLAEQRYTQALALLMQDWQTNLSAIADVKNALSAVREKQSLAARSVGHKKL